MYFQTISQFLSILLTKNIIDDIGINDNFLMDNDYTHLINPYKDLVATGLSPSGKRIYKNQTKLSYFFELKKCDEYISLNLISLIDRFEKKFKSALSYVVCSSFSAKGYDNCDKYEDIYKMDNNPLVQPISCLLPYSITIDNNGRNNASNDTKAKDRIIEVIKKLESGDSQKCNAFCSNYLSRHNCLPFYIMITAFSFSDLCYLFESLTFEARKKVYGCIFNVRDYVYNDDVIDFTRKLSDIRTVRNITHHHEPIIAYIIGLKKSDIFYSIIRLLIKANNVTVHKCEIDIHNPDVCFIENEYNKKHLLTIKKVISLLEAK